MRVTSARCIATVAIIMTLAGCGAHSATNARAGVTQLSVAALAGTTWTGSGSELNADTGNDAPFSVTVRFRADGSGSVVKTSTGAAAVPSPIAWRIRNSHLLIRIGGGTSLPDSFHLVRGDLVNDDGTADLQRLHEAS